MVCYGGEGADVRLPQVVGMTLCVIVSGEKTGGREVRTERQLETQAGRSEGTS